MTTKTRTTAAALAAITCIALGACSNMDRGSNATMDNGAMAASGTGTSGASGATAGANTMTGTGAGADTRQMPASSMYGVVQNIESVARGQAGDMTGSMSGAAGSSGTAGATGGAGDMVYRVTLRLDDGGSRAIYQEATPAYQIGDRVRMADGALQRY